MDDNERDLVLKLKMEMDDSFSDVQKDIDKLGKTLDKTKTAAVDTGKAFQQMREQSEKLKQVGTNLAMFGAAIAGPLTLAGKAYLDGAAKYKDMAAKGQQLTANQKAMIATSDKWDASMTRVSEAFTRIGGVVVNTVLPYLEKATPYLEKMADFVEKHPEAIQAALAIAGGALAAGGALNIAGTVMQTVGTIGMLAGGGGAGAAGAGAAGLAPAIGAAVVAALPVIALAASTAALVALLNSQQGQEGITAGKQLIAMLLGGFAAIFGGVEAGQKVFLDTSHALGLMTDAAYKTGTASVVAANAQNSAANVFWGIAGNILGFLSNPLIAGFLTQAMQQAGSRRDIGGYGSGGMTQMHPGEFVIDANTTRALEQVSRGRLDQSSILQMVTGGNKSITYNDSRRFDSKLSANDRASIRGDLQGILAEAFA